MLIPDKSFGMTIPDFAKKIGVSYISLLKEIERGYLKPIRVGRRKIITVKAQEDYLQLKERQVGL